MESPSSKPEAREPLAALIAARVQDVIDDILEWEGNDDGLMIEDVIAWRIRLESAVLHAQKGSDHAEPDHRPPPALTQKDLQLIASVLTDKAQEDEESGDPELLENVAPLRAVSRKVSIAAFKMDRGVQGPAASPSPSTGEK